MYRHPDETSRQYEQRMELNDTRNGKIEGETYDQFRGRQMQEWHDQHRRDQQAEEERMRQQQEEKFAALTDKYASYISSSWASSQSSSGGLSLLGKLCLTAGLLIMGIFILGKWVLPEGNFVRPLLSDELFYIMVGLLIGVIAPYLMAWACWLLAAFLYLGMFFGWSVVSFGSIFTGLLVIGLGFAFGFMYKE